MDRKTHLLRKGEGASTGPLGSAGTKQGASNKKGGKQQKVGAGSANPLPWLAILLGFTTVFYLQPALEVIRLSFTNSSLLRDRYRYTFDTLQDVATSGTDQDALKVSLMYIVVSVALQFVLGMVAALALQRGTNRRLWGTGLVRSVVLTAWITPGIVVGVLWRIILNEASYGMVNSMITNVGLEPIAFFSDKDIAIWTVIIAGAWRGTAFTMILLYAGLQAIPTVFFEAAEVDGASPIQTFRRVTLPQLRPIIAINLILATIGAMNTFDMVLSLTGGGPGRATEVMALLTYNRLFVKFDLSEASVLALIMLSLSMLFTLLYMRFLQEEI